MTRIAIVLILLGNIVYSDETGQSVVRPHRTVGSKNVTRKEGEHVRLSCDVRRTGQIKLPDLGSYWRMIFRDILTQFSSDLMQL